MTLDSGPTSTLITTDAGGLVLRQDVSIAAPIAEVWAAYTTADGWMAWAAPRADVDLRVGGTIRTAYDGEIGGPATNTLQILNYVPERLLTLRADVSANWPEIMKQDADRLSNAIVFSAPTADTTLIQSYGIGYSDAPAYRDLMAFFIPANEGLLRDLKSYLESGTRTDWRD